MNMPLGVARRTRVARARSLQENVLMPQLELADPYIKMKAVGEAGIKSSSYYVCKTQTQETPRITSYMGQMQPFGVKNLSMPQSEAGGSMSKRATPKNIERFAIAIQDENLEIHHKDCSNAFITISLIIRQ